MRENTGFDLAKLADEVLRPFLPAYGGIDVLLGVARRG